MGKIEESPVFYGAVNEKRQKTLIVDKPTVMTHSDFNILSVIAKKVVNYMDEYQLLNNIERIAADPIMMNDSLAFDRATNSHLVYGGLDLYKTASGEFKILEINSHVQAMGLQDFRLESLGVFDQPLIVNHFINLIQNREYKKVVVLGSRKNPFWRAHSRVSKIINSKGVDSRYVDTQSFQKLHKSGFEPDAIIRFCSTSHFLYHRSSDYLRQIAVKNSIPVLNATSAIFFGHRGFLKQASENLPDLFPRQIELSRHSTEDVFQEYPWLKLDAPGAEFVTNFKVLKRWAKNAVIALIELDYAKFDEIIQEKETNEAKILVSLRHSISSSSKKYIKWIAQESLKPSEVKASFKGRIEKLRILYRTYWVKKDKRKIDISVEGYGCTPVQFSRSRGKINGGTGMAVPMIIS